MNSQASQLGDETLVHRIGGGNVDNLLLKVSERALSPPGISLLVGDSPADAAEAMRRQFPRMAPRGKTVVGVTTICRIRQAGFDVIMDPTQRFPQHARLIHPSGVAGFSRENVERLALCFRNEGGL